MSKILCIPDLHCRKFWRKPIEIYSDKVDKIIFLGDYLDPYGDEIEENPELMECNSFYDSKNLLKMLEDIVSLKKNEPDKYILLTGNHTDSYIWSKFNAASRTDYRNWEKYHKFFSQNLEYFNLVWIEDNVIFSHAGISEEWAKSLAVELSPIDLDKPVIKSIAEYLSNVNLNILDKKLIELLGDISHYRGGDSYYGSCEWADIREHIEKVISYENNTFVGKGDPGIFQVFGHTQLKAPLICDKWACLDCRKAFIFDTETHECKDCI